MKPDFYINLINKFEHLKNSNSYVKETFFKDLDKSFEYILKKEIDIKPYNFEFIEFISNNLLNYIVKDSSDENLEDSSDEDEYLEDFSDEDENLEDFIKANVKHFPDKNFESWKKNKIDSLRDEYKTWFSRKNVFSYFVIAQGKVGFIGILEARIENDYNNIPSNHILGSNYNDNIVISLNNSFRVVKCYLIYKLNIDKKIVESALNKIVIQYAESILSKFEETKGCSYTFLFTSLVFCCAIQYLIEINVINAKNVKNNALLKPNDIKIPSDIIMTGEFKEIPDDFMSKENYKKIETKIVVDVDAKINSALGINKVLEMDKMLGINKFLLPNGVSFNNKELLNPTIYEGDNIYKNSTIKLIPIKTLDDLILALFPNIEFKKNKTSKVFPIKNLAGTFSFIAIFLFIFTYLNPINIYNTKFSKDTESKEIAKIIKENYINPISEVKYLKTEILTNLASVKLEGPIELKEKIQFQEINKILDEIFNENDNDMEENKIKFHKNNIENYIRFYDDMSKNQAINFKLKLETLKSSLRDLMFYLEKN